MNASTLDQQLCERRQQASRRAAPIILLPLCLVTDRASHRRQRRSRAPTDDIGTTTAFPKGSPPAPSLPTATSSAARHDRSREVCTACEQVKIHMHHGTTACAPSAATSTLPPHCRCPRHASLTACSASSAPRTQAWAPPTRRQRVANRPAIGRPCGPQQPLRCSRAATGAHTLQGKAAVCRGAGAVCGTRGTSPWHALRVARRRPPAGAPLGCPQRSRACGN